MQLFYAPDITGPDYTLEEQESKHCVRVLRLGRGDLLHITDGRGNLFTCRIEEDDPRRCTVRVCAVEREYGKLSYDLTLAVAPTKQIERFEWFLEKATEVGIGTIVPLETARSERRTIKADRETKVITSAVKQSLKAYHPRLQEMTPFEALVGEPFAGLKLIAHCDEARSQEGKTYLPDLLPQGGEVLVLIGPEGDFTPAEIDLALRHGFREVTLGTQRLRTETAAVAAAVMVSVHNAPRR